MRKKGQQCAAWVDAGKLRSDRAHMCIAACWRYAETVTKHPELLTDRSIQSCEENYANTKNQLPGMKKPAIAVTKAPETIDDMVNDMNKATQEWKVKLENASDSTSKRQAQECHDACSRGATRISRAGYRIDRAQKYWANCTWCGDSESRVLANEKTKTKFSSMPNIEGEYLQYIRSGFRVRVEGREDWKIYCNEAARIKDGQDEFARKIKPKDRVRFVGITYDAKNANQVKSHCVAESAIILESN